MIYLGVFLSFWALATSFGFALAEILKPQGARDARGRFVKS